MRRITHASETTGSKREPRPQRPAVRTYRQIAHILAEKWSTPVSSARAKRMCQAARNKLVRALMADPVICELLLPDADPSLN